MDMPDIIKNMKFRLKQLMKQTVQQIILPLCYELNRYRRTDSRLIIFADAHHDSCPPAMELLVEKVKKEGSFRVLEIYHDYGKCGAISSLLYSMRFMSYYAEAGTLVICDNFLPAASCRKKRETRVVQLWHACGCYKKFGYDAVDDVPVGYHGHVFRNTDLVTVSGKAARQPFSSAMRLDISRVRAAGVSRTDLYFSREWQESCRKEFGRLYPQAEGRKKVLWAPTFRGNAAAPSCPDLDPDRLQQELGEDYFLLTRLHPHMRHGLKPYPLTSEELYPSIDLLIADYSSLIYEYLLFEKPIVLYVPDLREYEGKRGFYMDIREIPGLIVTDRDHLAGTVREALAGGEERKEEIRRFLKKYMGACDGGSTDRICRWIREHAEKE